MQEANDAEGVPSLIADLSIRYVWQPQTVALFHVLVTDTDAPSHSRVVTAVLSSAEEEISQKQQLFSKPPSHLIMAHVLSVDGVLHVGREANFLFGQTPRLETCS